MQCGEEYDYFFEVDGELRYDYYCEYRSVEVVSDATSSAAAAAVASANLSSSSSSGVQM